MGGLGISYFRIEKQGVVPRIDVALPDVARDACAVFRALYAFHGFVEPWVGYLGVSGGTVVCTCGFKSPPRDSIVEIGDATLPQHGGKGIGDMTARMLLHMAERTDPKLTMQAHTAPDENASVAILRKHGFAFAGIVEDEEGQIGWRWLRSGKAL